MAREFIRAHYRKTELAEIAPDDGDYSELCRALFNLNAFVYAE
jgi:hypothetical protein